MDPRKQRSGTPEGGELHGMDEADDSQGWGNLRTWAVIVGISLAWIAFALVLFFGMPESLYPYDS